MDSIPNEFFYVATINTVVAQSHLANDNLEICFEIISFC